MRHPAIKLSRQSELDLSEKSENNKPSLPTTLLNDSLIGAEAFTVSWFFSVTFNRHLKKKNLLFSKSSI